ncbi:TPA: FMN-binding glutamate synthase family protein [Candidatus Woesearchaeota archaeon]|nr:FMN-binding glutamate synthase family protein [Candidatus Woesearchaeota archaeon]
MAGESGTTKVLTGKGERPQFIYGIGEEYEGFQETTEEREFVWGLADSFAKSGALQLGSGNNQYSKLEQTLFPTWREANFVGGGLIYLPGNPNLDVDISVTLGGPLVEEPVVLNRPIWRGGISYGSTSDPFHIVQATAENRLGMPYNGGEGGLVKRIEEITEKIIVQYASGRAGVSAGYLTTDGKRTKIIEIKMGQGAKPSKGGQLTGQKVFPFIADLRFVKPWQDFYSPAHPIDVSSVEDLKAMILKLREATRYQSVIGVKIGPNDIMADVITAAVALDGDGYIEVAGAGGGTAAATKNSMQNFGVPTIYAVAEARWALDQLISLDTKYKNIKLGVSGGLGFELGDVQKAIFAGADFVTLGKAFMIAAGCIDCNEPCYTGECPTGTTSHEQSKHERNYTPPQLEMHIARVMNYSNAQAAILRDILRSYNRPSLFTRTGERNIGPQDLIALTERASLALGIPYGTPNGPNFRNIALQEMKGQREFPSSFRKSIADLLYQIKGN